MGELTKRLHGVACSKGERPIDRITGMLQEAPQGLSLGENEGTSHIPGVSPGRAEPPDR